MFKVIRVVELLEDYEEISLCKMCSGRGWSWSILEFGDGPADQRKVPCATCDGSGRVKTVDMRVMCVVPATFKGEDK